MITNSSLCFECIRHGDRECKGIVSFRKGVNIFQSVSSRDDRSAGGARLSCLEVCGMVEWIDTGLGK